MENEDIDFDKIEADADKNLQAKNRYQQLSEKVRTEAQAREQAEAKAKTEVDARLKTEKERDFYKDFSQISSKYPEANSYQDKILEKVHAGLTTEDATFAVLGKEGKLGGSMAPVTDIRPDNIAGGSASTAMSDSGDKRPEEMSQDERRNALLQAEKEGFNLLKFS